jgi:protein-S-isoprenylcysteine O-methyltransferase Ste14
MEQRRNPFVTWAVDIGERLFLVLLAIPFLWAFVRVMPLHPTIVLLMISESIGLGLILTRRIGKLSLGAVPVLAAFGGTALPLLVRPNGIPLAPSILCTGLMIAGLVLAIAAKLYLNRSFGLIAANRGVKVSGPYRFVRHPMYAGYMINQVGFLLMSFSMANLLLYLAAWSFQLVRVHEEERILSADLDYQHFSSRVPTKLLPGIY